MTAPAPTSRVDMAGASPSRRFAIAAAAPVLVATGNDDQPITLGDAHPYDTNKHVLHVWDWAAAKASKPLPLSYSGPLAVAPDGKTIAIADGRAIAVATGAVTPIDAFPPRVRAMKFAPDGKALLLQLPAADDAATHRLIAFPSGRLICDIPDTWTHTFAATFTPDGQSLVLMGADRVVRRFDAATGKEVAKYPPAHSNSVRALVISPDGKRLATCASSVGEIRLFDLATAKLLREFNVPPADAREPQVYSLAFSRDGRLLAGGGVHRLYLWDAGTAAVRHTFPRNSGGAIHLRFGADDKVLTAVFDFTGLERNGRDLLRYPHVETYAVP